MQNESLNEHVFEDGTAVPPAGASAGEGPSQCENNPQEISYLGGEQAQAESDGDDDQEPGAEPAADVGKTEDENRVQQRLNETSADIINGVSGNNNRFSNHVHYHADAAKDLAQFVTQYPLRSSKLSYKSLDRSNIVRYTGLLLTDRILLLSCYDDSVILNIGTSIAYENRAASKRLVTIEANCEGAYTLKNLIEALARHKGNDEQAEKSSAQPPPPTICVWAAHKANEGDISNAILDSLFISNAHLQQYQTQLSQHGLCLICLVSPQRLQDYKRSDCEIDLQNWEIDFLRPLLEGHRLSQFEELAETILGQRQEGLWSADDAEFCKEIGKHLRAGKLVEIVARKTHREIQDDLGAEQLFRRQDPLADTVLYCATYYPDLSPQDFSHLVQLFLGDATEEVIKRTDPARPNNGDEPATSIESRPLAHRWQRESDVILRGCKLAALTDENHKRVVDFQVDGLRGRLSRYIRDDHYFFYESQFVLMRQLGLLFSPRRNIATGARQLLVEMAAQYPPHEVANWLFEIVAEFEQMARTANALREGSRLFHLLPHAKLKAARRYVCHGLSLVLGRLSKEPDLQDAARIFWQKLLRTERQWFLDLLWQMGNSAPPETLSWLKQLLDQGTEEIRLQAHGYLIGYLLRRDSLVYATLKELIQWPGATQAGRAMQMVLIIYCVETNRRVLQQDYGQWPSAHPLFGFQTYDEAVERIALLIEWLFTAAFESGREAAMSIVADIIAGWYFILSPTPLLEPAGPANAEDGAPALNARTVRQLLLEGVAQHCSRSQKSGLLAVWESFRNDILKEVFQLEEFTNRHAEGSLNAKLMTDAATARRKLLDTRALLGQLRKEFICCAAEVAHG